MLVRHEQAAAHAADGYARASGRAGVCVATSGPGATNLVTGLATAHMDSTPRRGHHRPGAARHDRPGRLPGDRHHRHHPADHQAHRSWCEDVEELADAVREAFAVATEGRPGPVLVDVPKDVQNQKAESGGRAAGGRADQGRSRARLGRPPPDRLTALAEAAQPHRARPSAR